MTVLFRRCSCSLLVSVFCLISFAPLPLSAQSGLGVSGSFAGSRFTMVAGERLNSENNQVTFYNTSSSSVTVTLTGKGPQGTIFEFDQSPQLIAAHGELNVPVSFTLSPNLAEGTYPIAVRADLVSDRSGVNITGFAQLSASVKVLGEAGDVHITLKDIRHQPFPATLTLSLIDDDKLVELYQSESGEMSKRLVPGHYRISAMVKDTQVALKDFVLKDKEDLRFELIAQTVFVKAFMVGANLDEKGRIQSAEIVYTIRNIDRSEPNAALSLRLTQGTRLKEEVPMMSLPELPKGEISGRFAYYPKDGFSSGELGLTLIVKSSDDLILAQSETRSLLIDKPESFNPDFWMIIAGASLPILGLLITKNKRIKH